MGSGPRSIARRLALAAALLTLTAAAAAAPAQAAEAVSHPFLEKLTGGAGDPGQRHPQNPFEDACGAAKDSSGYIYVSDYHHDVIDIFSTAFGKEFVTTIGEVDPGNGPCGLAVDSAGDVYVNDWREDVVELTPSSYPPGQFATYTPTTIDQSGSATDLALDGTTGDLYVDDGTYVSEYDSSGNLIRKIGEDESAEYFGLAVNEANGNLYVADALSGTVKAFDPASDTKVAELDGKGTPQGGFDYLGDASLAIDNSATSPSYEHLFVVDNIQHGVSEHPEAVLDEFNAAGEFRSQIAHWIVREGEPKVPVEYWLLDAEPSGLALTPKGEVLVTNGNDEGSVLDVFGPTVAGKLLSVTETGTGAGTVMSKPAGIFCPGACTAEYDEGSEVKLTATPDAHSAFKGWTGCNSVPSPETCRVMISAAKAVSAEFEALPQQNLTVGVEGSGEGTVSSEPAGIECSVGNAGTCVEHFNRDSTVTLAAAPAPHTRFKEWVGLPCEESTLPICPVTMSADEAVDARFEAIPPQPLEVSVSGEGTVTSEPAGIACPPTCTEHFDEGSTVNLEAIPVAHRQLAAWGGACAGTAASEPCQVTMSEARSVSAAFVPILRALTVQIAGQGAITADHGAISTCTATCAGTYLDGEAVTLHAAAASGFTFAGWSGGCGGTGICALAVSADIAVIANFSAIPPPVEPLIAHLSLGKPSVRGASATLKANVSAAGSLTASGKGLESAHARVSSAGSLVLHLSLSAAGKKALERRGRLAVKMTVTFVPAAGAPVSAAKTVFFQAKRRRARRKHR